LTLPGNAEEAFSWMAEHGIAGGLPLGRFYPGMEREMLFCVTEKRSRKEINMLSEVLAQWLRS
jgi:glycine dehydrogenase subunit 1